MIAAAGKARIFRLGAEYYACRQGGHRIDIGAPAYGGQSSLALDHFRLNRRFVAWAVNQFSDSYGNSDFYIEVVDLMTGRHVTEVPTGNVPAYANPLPGDRGVGPTTALVMAGNGSVAWIAKRNLEDAPYYEVWRHDARGATRLDAGGNVDPTSLRLRTYRLEWTRAGHVTTSDIAR